jgi:acyl carrier protein
MSVERTEIEDRLREIFEQRLSIRLPDDEVDLIDSGLIDSLMLMELLANREDTFRIDLSEAELEVDDFRTAARIVSLVEARAESAGPRETDSG